MRTLFRLFKWLIGSFLFLLLALAIGTTALVLQSGDPSFAIAADQLQINDPTRLNPVRVARIVRPHSTEEIALLLRDSSGPVSIGGGHFSQGGQTAWADSLHLDMRAMDRVLAFDPQAKRVTVQAGITWRALQEAIDPAGLAVAIMQTYANFTVGGSISVNAHGRYMGEGPLVHSVERLRVVLADGSVVDASPQENPEIFYAAVGGYGGIGVITEATLRLADNTRIERRTATMPVEAYPAHFQSEVRDSPDVVMHNADIYPPDYTAVRDVSWYRSDKPLTDEQRLIPVDREYAWGPRLARFAGEWEIGKWLRRYAFEPLYYAFDRVVWRNWEASYDVRELPPSDTTAAYGLREYFVPVERFADFVPRLRDVFQRHHANILNVSIRHARPDPGTLLAWARGEVFAFVVYYRQDNTREAQAEVDAWTREMADAVLEAGGTWYLPYQNAATPEQFLRAYPRAPEYFALKRQLDPHYRFRSRFWSRYYPEGQDALAAARAQLPDYARGEEQTLLTIPEWYLVFNPVEYADYLQAGKDPSAFPFFASIDAYWTLYDRVYGIARTLAYPGNDEYLTMLRVIGISTTAEYALKGAWEGSIGRLTRWLADGENTDEDRLIANAQRAYSELIYTEPWYRFAFWPWVERIWNETSFFGRHFTRKLERKLEFTLEFGVKTLYARLIRHAAESTYGPTDTRILLTARGAATDSLPAGVTILHDGGERQILAVPRWGGFSVAVPELLRRGIRLEDVSGNGRMALTVLSEPGSAPSFASATELFRVPMVSQPGAQRIVLFAEVPRLGEVLAEVEASGAQLEHLYDY